MDKATYRPPCVELAHFSDKDQIPAVAFVRWRHAPPPPAEKWRVKWHPVCDPHVPDDPDVLVTYLAADE